jgi:hypothetical protein
MFTTARRAAKPVSLIILMMFVVGPGLVSAGPQPVAAADDETMAAPSRPLAVHSWTFPADLTPCQGSRSLDNPPLWTDTHASASTPAKTGSWWSRRTTAQKTWFIVGIVAGAAGIYAIASNHSGGGSGGWGGY